MQFKNFINMEGSLLFIHQSEIQAKIDKLADQLVERLYGKDVVY